MIRIIRLGEDEGLAKGETSMPWNPLSRLRIARLRAENAALRAEAAELRAEQRLWRAETDHPHPVVPELLVLADWLADLTKQGAEETDPEQAATALRWLDGRLIRLFALCDVADLHDEGPVDPVRHEIVGSRPADDGRPAGSIARTVRHGYVWRGRVLRRQQVIMYAEEPD
ncbi:nucleotide exchange factor GrpE [Streptomyces palmae]|uniref:Nucleotide exchange factor GrpE n=1 Tax=Streptomyces palmae TaxID=1701085 RepID=A0A4Z0G576_9ACTN|nr:nucleotide exchange factor GrpE [Streptomyces palmae]TGA91184.1 nucleotide exchange factor GrpE [Streptomyces palmae]